METTLQLSQRQQKYTLTLTLFKMAANTNIEKASDLAPFMEEVQKTTVSTTNLQRNIERGTRKSTAGKQSGRNSIKVLNMSSLSFPFSSMLKNTHNYKKTRLMKESTIPSRHAKFEEWRELCCWIQVPSFFIQRSQRSYGNHQSLRSLNHFCQRSQLSQRL